MILIEDVIYILLKNRDNVMDIKFLCIPSVTLLSTGYDCRELKFFKKTLSPYVQYFYHILLFLCCNTCQPHT